METSIDKLDAIELERIPKSPAVVREKVPESTPKPDPEPEAQAEKETETVRGARASEESSIVSDTLLLFALSSVVIHPSINKLLNKTIDLGGFTFLVKALIVTLLYIVLQRLLK